MKKFLTILILATISMHSAGQKPGISLTTGIGSFQMNDLRQYQDMLILRAPVPLRAFSTFPPYTYFSIDAFLQQPSGWEYGLLYGFAITGAHASYSDFSGYLNLDQTVSAYQFGAHGGKKLLSTEMGSVELALAGYADLRLGFMRDRAAVGIQTNYYRENNELILKAFSPLAEGGLELRIDGREVSLGIRAGYQADAGMKFTPGDETQLNATVPLLPEGDLRSGLSGWRTGIRLIKWFSNIEPTIE